MPNSLRGLGSAKLGGAPATNLQARHGIEMSESTYELSMSGRPLQNLLFGSETPLLYDPTTRAPEHHHHR